MYTTNSAEAVFHVLDSSNANIVVVDDSKQMDKIKEIKHRLPNLKAAIQLYGPYEPYVKREDGYYRVCDTFFNTFSLIRFISIDLDTFGIEFCFCSTQWTEIQEFDVSDQEEELEKRLDNIHANDCCVLVYTVSKFIIFTT